MSLKLSSVQIESFLALARELNFSRAAESLHITQPALTKRIQNLEEQLGQPLFVRLRGGLELTESGRILQRHASSMHSQERELLDSLVGGADGVAGFFRLASFSSALRSVLLPAIGNLLRQNPNLTCQLAKAEVHELHDLLIDGRVDFCVSLNACERSGVENVRIGTERNVLIESALRATSIDCYIDHNPRDNFTELYFLRQTGATAPTMKRNYFDDIYGVIDAVAAGIGRAIAPIHLVHDDRRVRILPNQKPFDVDVFLHYRVHDSHTRMQRTVIAALVEQSSLLYARYLAESESIPGGAGRESSAQPV